MEMLAKMAMHKIKKKNSHALSTSGFTLVELLITLAITGLILSAVFSVYIANIHAVSIEEQRVDLQQNQRFAIDLMTSQLRMAGYDLAESTVPTVLDARTDFVYFTLDLNDDGNVDGADDSGEHIAFCTYTDGDGVLQLGYTVGNGTDTDGNGTANVGEFHSHNHQPVVAIEALEFYYTLADGTRTTAPTIPDDVRAVDISVLVKTEWQNPKYQSLATTFLPASNPVTGTEWTVAANDGFMRRMVISSVRLRNMGL